jgi:uroporphyrinogen III methyltransferase / synthase
MIVLTRDEAGNAAWQRQFTAAGIETYNLPAVETTVADITPEVEEALMHLGEYSWIIVPGPTAAQHFAELTAELGLPLRNVTQSWIATDSQNTADIIRSMKLVVAFVPSRPHPGVLAKELKRVKSRNILYLRTHHGPAEAVDILRRRSARVTDLAVSQARPLTERDLGLGQLLRDGEITRLVFSQPASVAGFWQRVGESVALEIAQGLPAVAVGSDVADTLAASGFRDIRPVQSATVRAIAGAV